MQNTIIKDYQVKSDLGQGGMATVYLAHDIKFQTNVAIKVLNKEYVHNDNIRKRFIAEARNMFKMSHPNIIKVTDLIDEGDTVAFVMEYIEGETLKEYLDRKGKLSDDEIKTIFSQMLEAVGYVHDKKLVHRDIKPSNFMINSEGQVKLLDFGIAKTTDVTSSEYTQTGTGIQMGTPLYMSPEQVKSSKEVGPSSDIYSLGVVLWQIVMGKKPYDSSTLSSPEIQVSILKEPLPLTNTQWDYLIQIATAKPIENRFKNTAEFLAKLINSSNTEQNTNNIISEKTVAENSAFQSDKNVTSNKFNNNKYKNINSTNKPKNFFVNNRKLLIGLILLVSVFTFWFFWPQENKITVPNLTNMTEEQVKETLGHLDLNYVLLDSIDFNPAFPKLTVVEQEPIAGSIVNDGSKVYITLNASGYAMVTFPDLKNKTFIEAKNTLIALGLVVGDLKYVPHIAKDIVLDVSYNGRTVNVGDKLMKNSKIDIVLGDGKDHLMEEELIIDDSKTPRPSKPIKKNESKPKQPKVNTTIEKPNNIKRKIPANTTKPKQQDDLNPNVDDDFEI
jgi:serine/threonine-protein kinase